MNQDQPTIKQTISSAFRLAEDAAMLRETFAQQLPRCIGRDHAVAHRAYVMLGDFIVAFGQLSDKIAASSALGGRLR